MSQLELIVEVDEEQLTLLIEDAVQHLEDISAEAGNILQREVDGLYVPDTSVDKVDKEVGKSLISDAELIRLATVATDATKNASDASLRDRSTHTGSQPINTVEGLTDALDSKVDKVVGKKLTDENFTEAEKTKLAGLESSRFKGAYTSLASLQSGVVSPQAGDYADVDNVGADVVRYIYDVTDSKWVVQQGTTSITSAQIKQLYESNPDTNSYSDDDKSVVSGVTSALSTKVDKVVGKQLSDENYTTADKDKVAGIQAGAQVNAVTSVSGKTGAITLTKEDVGLSNVDNTSDINKPISNPTQAALESKVDKAAGKGLSDTNFTQAEKDKLSYLEGSKFVGLFVNESALPLSGSEGDYANVDGGVGSDVYRVIWDSSDNKWVRAQGVSTELTDAQIKQQYESNPDTNAFTDDEKAKLASVANGATANRADSENADKVHDHDIATTTKAGFMSVEQVEMLAELEQSSISISGPRSVYTDRDYVYTISDFDSFTDYSIQVSEGTAVLDGDKINLRTPSLDTELILTLYAGSRRRDIAIDVSLSQYINEPTPTPANFGDPLEGGFYAGMIWNRIALSTESKTLATGRVVFLVDQLGALVYEGQMLEVRSISDPSIKFQGTVAVASSGSIGLDVASVQGSGTYSDWAVMSRFRNIIAPKAQGESAPIAMKSEATAAPIATQTLTEGWEATNAMLAAGTAAQYPAAHWARALVINGYSDWYIPARDELELAWRNLKPVTADNKTGSRLTPSTDYKQSGAYPDTTAAQGVNLNSSPQSPAYTLTVPAQTSSTAFRAGGSEEFAWGFYFWASSETSAANAWVQYWHSANPGQQIHDTKTTLKRVRAVRRSII